MSDGDARALTMLREERARLIGKITNNECADLSEEDRAYDRLAAITMAIAIVEIEQRGVTCWIGAQPDGSK